MAFSTVTRFPRSEVYAAERAARLKARSEAGDDAEAYKGMGKQRLSTQRTEPRVFMGTAPRFGTSSPSKRPSTAPTRSLGVPVAAVAAVPSFGAKEPKAGLRNSRKVLFSVAPRFPEDVPRKKKPEKKSAETGFAQLETPVYSSFGKQAAAGRPSSSGVVFPTTDRRRVMRSIAAPDVDPWEGGRAKPSKLKRYPSAHFGSQTRFSGKHVLGVNVYASPGPAQHDAMAATLRTKRASARQPAWAKPPKKELRDKSGRPKDMNIYRF